MISLKVLAISDSISWHFIHFRRSLQLPREEAVTLIGSLICYPNMFPDMPLHQPGHQTNELQPNCTVKDIKVSALKLHLIQKCTWECVDNPQCIHSITTSRKHHLSYTKVQHQVDPIKTVGQLALCYVNSTALFVEFLLVPRRREPAVWSFLRFRNWSSNVKSEMRGEAMESADLCTPAEPLVARWDNSIFPEGGFLRIIVLFDIILTWHFCILQEKLISALLRVAKLDPACASR